MKRKSFFSAMKKSPILASMETPTTSSMRLRTFLEALEPRIAPAGLAGINYLDVTLGTPQLLKAGQGLKANGQYLIAVTQGQALIFTTDINGSNQFAPNDITGIAAGNGLKLTSFVNINGDIVTDLQSNGTLSDTSGNANGHNGLLLLNSTIDAITLRSVTAADVTPADLALAQKTNPSATAASIYTTFLAPSTYSINGNIYAGGGVGDGVAGDGIVIDTAGSSLQASQFSGNNLYYEVSGIAPSLGTIKTGTAAGGSTFSFGYYSTGIKNGEQYVGTPGVIPVLAPFTPGIGVAGGGINGLLVGNGASNDTGTTPSSPVPFTISALDAGNGGVGAAGGSISNITLDGNSGGLQIVAGNGGDGPTGGNGGSITNLNDISSVEGVVQIQTGNGGEGYIGAGGTAGALALGQFSMNGDIHMGLGHGGSALGNAGSGNSLTGANLIPTSSGGIATAVSIITTYRTAGDISSPKLIDFNDDGYADAIFVTNSPDQIGIIFGGPNGMDSTSPVLYLASPGVSTQAYNSPDVVVGDFTGQYYADGTPILDVAIASSTPNNTAGISVFLNPATQSGTGDGYHGTIGVAAGAGSWSQMAVNGEATGQNFVSTPTLTAPLPVLNSTNTGDFIYSGAAVTNLVVGDFNHAYYPTGKPNAPTLNPILDLAYTTQVFSSGLFESTATVMLDGTGDGHFFANFNYNSATFQPTNMPVLDSGEIAEGTHAAYQLVATAAVSGDSNSDMLILTGQTPPGTEIKLIQDLNTTQEAALNGTTFSGSSFGNTYPGYALTSIVSTTPFYDEATYDQNGNIAGFQTVSPATPIAVSVTTHPGSAAGSGNGGSAFMAVVLDQGNAITTAQGAYTPVPGSDAGLASFSTNVNAIQGVLLEDPHPNGILNPNGHSPLFGIVAGDFGDASITTGGGGSGGSGAATLPPQEFAVYGSGSGIFTGLYVLDLANNGLLHTAKSYNADLTVDTSLSSNGASEGYSSSIVAFGAYNVTSHTTDSTITPSLTTLNNILTNSIGFIAAVPTTTANAPASVAQASLPGLINGGGNLGSVSTTSSNGFITETFADVSLGLNTYSLTLSAGNGGNSRLGSGGAGGTIGSTNTALVNSLNVTLPSAVPDQPLVFLNPGTGGTGLINGGAGGGLQSLNLLYATGTSILGGLFDLVGANGGAGLFGTGGAGGGLSNLQVQTGELFAGGNGGSGYHGGAGGIVNGTAGVNGYSSQNDIIVLAGGNGGNGIVSGGNGGTVTGFAAEFLPLTVGADGYLNYQGGAGGNAIAGIGGAGGSILNCSPLSSINNLAGPIILNGGVGGNGLTGGAGGSITNFSNQSTSGTPVSVVAVQAGNGGTGVSGNGGLGGGVSNFYAAGAGTGSTQATGSVSVANQIIDYSYQYNSIIAGDGGNSYGATGGNGGTLSSVNNVAVSSAEAMAAGAGGDGLKRGGNGGAVLSGIGSSADTLASKLLVIAGVGGNAYAALATGPGVANLGDTSPAIISLRAFGNVNGIAGNGGSITNFKQQVGTSIAVDMIAGNGGSLMNYGSTSATTTSVGTGGSINNTSLLGNAGRINSAVGIQNYNNGDITGFVHNTLVYNPTISSASSTFSTNSTTSTTTFSSEIQLTDSVGNVGVVVGAAGMVKGGLPAGDAGTKTGSVITFAANSIMSMVAGSVDRIAAINTVSGVSVLTGNSGAGSYKNSPIPHDASNTVYYDANGAEVSTPQIGGALMDGAIVIRSGGNKNNLIGQRIFVLG